jgi:Ca2+-binding RTX toxin-like protein
MTTIISTDQNTTVRSFDQLWVLAGASIVTTGPVAPAIENRLGTGGPLVLDTFVRIDGQVLSSETRAIYLAHTGGQASNHRLVIGAEGRVLSGAFTAAVEVEGIGSIVQNWGEIAGGGGVQMFEAGLGSFENHGIVSGADVAAFRALQISSLSVLNTGTLAGVFGIEVDDAQAEIRNTGTISGSGGTAISVRSGTASIVLTNLGDISGAITVNAGIAFSDIVTNGGRILGNVDLGEGGDSFLGRDGTLAGLLFGGAGSDLLVTGAGDESIFCGTGNDVARGGAGEDSLTGDSGNDTLSGQDGEDDLRGDAGRDRLNGGRGDDTLRGGADQDTFVFGRHGDDDRVADFADGTDRVDLSAFHFANAAAALAGAAGRSGGVLLDLSAVDGGTVFLSGLTLAQFTAADLIL